MAQQLTAYSISAPGFYGLNTQESSLDLDKGWALVANNCVIDKYGRIGARQGWTKVNSAVNTDLSTNDVKAIGELITVDGTSWIICAGNNKLYKLVGSTLTTLTYGGGGTAPTITADNWQMASLNGGLYLFQTGHDPLEFKPDTSNSQFRRISEISGYAGTVPQADSVISAYGRLWCANTAADKVTVAWCDLLLANKWNTGTAGTLNISTVWPKGGDTIAALGAHNGFLYIFGKNNILVYQGATTPSTISLQDVITGIGCYARDTIQNTGSDLVFLSATGVRSILRTIQEKSQPLNDLSRNVRNDLISAISGEVPATIKSIYSPLDGFYAITLPVLKSVYCFDTKASLQDGSLRVTTWDSIEPKSFCRKADGVVLLGKAGYVAKYGGYLDNTSTYRFQYFTNHTDLGAPSYISILKRLKVVVIGGSNQYLTMKWGYDFTGNYYSENVLIPSQAGTAFYGVSEYNTAGTEYTGGTALQELTAYPTGSGKVIQTGYEANINSIPLSIQKLEIHAKNGKLI
jgi:hypothetical protein